MIDMKTKTSLSRKQLSELEYVDFEVEREDWNRFKLADNALLKTKYVLINVLMEKGFREKIKKTRKEKGEIGLGIELKSTNAIGIKIPPELSGTPSDKRYSIEELRASIVEDDIDFETVKGTWNIYNLEGIIQLKIRHTPIHVGRTNKYDILGIPIYIVDFTADVVAKPTKE